MLLVSKMPYKCNALFFATSSISPAGMSPMVAHLWEQILHSSAGDFLCRNLCRCSLSFLLLIAWFAFKITVIKATSTMRQWKTTARRSARAVGPERQSFMDNQDSERTRAELLMILSFVDIDDALKTGKSDRKCTGPDQFCSSFAVSSLTVLLMKAFSISTRYSL